MTKSKARYKNLSASSALPESHDGQFARLLIYAIVAAMLTLFAWAAVTPVNEITTGSGTIKTRILAEQVEHPEGGVVKDVLVATGDVVETGTPLLAFDTSSLAREQQKLSATQVALRAERQRIEFVLSGTGHIPDFADLAELSPEELLFWVEQSFLDAQLDLIDADSRSVLSAIDMLHARQNSLRRELLILEARLARTRKGQQSGAIPLNTVDAVEREFLQLQRSLLESRGEIIEQQNALETNKLRKAELLARRSREAALRRAEIEEQIVAVEQAMAETQARMDRAIVRATVAVIAFGLESEILPAASASMFASTGSGKQNLCRSTGLYSQLTAWSFM